MNVHREPIISIIFPSFNGEKFLHKNLESIKTLNNLNEIELIIIDNNSNDSSIQIIESYKNCINIKLLKQKKNLGFAKACNIGALHAKGKFIFITNQDVILLPDFFLKLLTFYKIHKKNKEIIISPAIIFEGDGRIYYYGAKIHILGFSYTPKVYQKLPEKKEAYRTQRFSGCSFFIKKKIFLDMGGFDPLFFMYYEDTDFSLRWLRHGLEIYTTNDPYLIHLRHDLALNDLRYYFLELNKYIVFCKNINGFKKLRPFFIIIEIALSIQSILLKKFKLRIRLYREILFNIKFFKTLRSNSKKKMKLISYRSLSKTLDPVLIKIADLQSGKHFDIFLAILNSILKLI